MKAGAVRVINFPIVVELYRNGSKLREHWVTWGVPLAQKPKKDEIEAMLGFVRQFLPEQTLANAKGEQVKCIVGDPHTEYLDPKGFS